MHINFVTSGMQLDVRALFSGGAALALVPVFLLALLTPRDLVVVSSGRFHAVAHPGTGDGSYVLRLENLDIFNGPALYVYAVAAEDANDNKTVLNTSILDLGPLKGNKGNQTYELPAEFDPEKYRAISVWCRRFSVNFATALCGSALNGCWTRKVRRKDTSEAAEEYVKGDPFLLSGMMNARYTQMV